MAEDKKMKGRGHREVLERPCEACGDHTDQRIGERYVCRLCYGKSDAQRTAINSYCQGERDYADIALPEFLDRMFEEK